MTSFSGRLVAKHFLLIWATKKIKGEIEQAGLDNLKILAESGRSIVATYLQGCSPQEKAKHRRELSALLQMGVTFDMVLTELAGQIPELAPIIEGNQDYKKMEFQELERFVRQD